MIKSAMKLNFRLKKYFFDRQAVITRLGEKRARFLRNVGQYARVTAIRSMRRVGKKGKPSAPGQPPRHHGGTPSLRTILFGYDPATRGVVVGPVGLNQKQYFGGQLTDGAIPQLHEEGGEIGFREKFSPFDQLGARLAFGGRASTYIDSNFTMLRENTWRKIYGDEFVDHRKDSQLRGIWIPVGQRRRDRFLQRVRHAKYPARPFMGPARDKTIEKIPKLYFGQASAA